MDPNAMKNMIILKDLPSNMVEEAYVIFKDNIKIHKIEKAEKNKKNTKEEKPKDYIVKEAEMVINDYVSRIEEKEYMLCNGNKKLKEKYKRLKALTVLLTIFCILSSFVIIYK